MSRYQMTVRQTKRKKKKLTQQQINLLRKMRQGHNPFREASKELQESGLTRSTLEKPKQTAPKTRGFDVSKLSPFERARYYARLRRLQQK